MSKSILASGVSSAPPIHTQATARPWHVGSTRHTELVMGFRNDSECVIAELDTEMDMTDAENEANAALIVKAVNSHEALVKALEQCAAAFSTGPGTVATAHEEIAREFQRRMNIARAALAGAK